MRKPFYDSTRKRWRLQINQPDGPPRKVTLAADRETAFRLWKQMQSGEVDGNEKLCQRCMRRKAKPRGPAPAVLPSLRSEDVNKQGSTDPDGLDTLLNEVAGRYRIFERVMLLVELLSPLRRGATIQELHSDVQESIGRVSQRTVSRDLAFLASVGIVEKIGRRYRWVSGGRRAAGYESMSESLSMSEPC